MGIALRHVADLAPTYASGPRPGPLLRAFLKRALGVPNVETLEAVCNDPRYQEAIIPAGNLVGTADETCRFFQMMLNGGKWGRRRICQPATIARAVQEFGTRTVDQTLGIPMRYSAGLMLGDAPFGVWGPDTPQAFGHLGLVNKFNLIRTIGNRVPREERSSSFALSLA